MITLYTITFGVLCIVGVAVLLWAVALLIERLMK